MFVGCKKMIIREMFDKDINRNIGGVIKVDQDKDDIIEQEVKEYVITKELKKHFVNFFNYYSDAFENPTDDIGVWISGFFGSGKSHFLKMLSYILENKLICGIPTVEFFREKFQDDPGTFMMIDKSTRCTTETILFNIDYQGSINKDSTAVIRVFAKMFYEHLGFFGENLKVAMFEQYIDQLGKTEEFRRSFEEKKGKPWTEQRKAFAFNGKYIIPAMTEVLDISEEDAKRWFQDKAKDEISIVRLVEDMKEYVSHKQKDFRLLFMIDEVGQYVSTDINMLLNLQSLLEKIGTECGGKVWVMCTGQEAIDEIVKVRADQFSRIQARFKTRLSLSSSSVDEVIQKRLLKKKPEAEHKLEEVYDDNGSVVESVIKFENARTDIKGFSGSKEFADYFPFIPYQFIVMQKVFAEIRKHGNSGKHLSGGERSMLSGFQEAAKKIQTQDQYALIPFHLFYNTVHGFLDSAIRRVIERCQNAADTNAGIEPIDVDVLKILYLIRYIDDIPSNLENIVILMIDNIGADKIILRKNVRESLERLHKQNYVGKIGDTYVFLTDEEQDVQKDISNTNVDTSAIVEKIAHIIFGDIYITKKYRWGKYDFDFDKMVDGVVAGSATGGMKLRFMTLATDKEDKIELNLLVESKGQAIVVLPETSYYETLEKALKINKYVKQKNVPQLPKTMQDIIHRQQDEAARCEMDATAELRKAIINASFYVDGEHLEIRSGDEKSKIDQALEYLVSHVYKELSLIDKNVDTDEEIEQILTGNFLAGAEPNRNAAAKVEEYLIVQDRSKLPTSMFDVQSRYRAVPYGWREIDIAAVVALLINQQKVTIKYGGATIRPDNPKLIDMLRKKTEIGKTSISKRQVVTAQKLKNTRQLLRDYFDVMDVPEDEDGIVAFIINQFEDQKKHYEDLKEKYVPGRNYPDKGKVEKAIQIVADILSQKKDNLALIDRFLNSEDKLFKSKESLQAVEGFFQNQVQVFDAAAQMEEDLRNELDYLSSEEEAYSALNKIRKIIIITGGFSYSKIPELHELMNTVREGHERLLKEKRSEISDIITQCMAEIRRAADDNIKVKDVCAIADEYFSQQRTKVQSLQSLALLDGLVPPMLQYKDQTIERIEANLTPPKPIEPAKTNTGNTSAAPAPKKIIKPYNKAVIFPSKKLETEQDIDEYVEKIRDQLKRLLKNCDGIQLK